MLRCRAAHSPRPPLLPSLHRRTAAAAAAAAATTTHLSSPPPYKPPVGIFWDLRCRPPSKLRPLHAALRLRHFAFLLGPLRISLAFTSSPAQLPNNPHPLHSCPLCGRRFPDLPRHFHLLHRREHAKHVSRLASATASRRARLAATLAPKIDRYRRAVRQLSGPSTFLDDLREAGIHAAVVPDPAAATGDRAVEAVEAGAVGCVVVVSDDAVLEGAMREARARGARAVVVGDGGGRLRRCADAGLSWREVAGGKARERAEAAERRWRDGELLGRLEWTYRSEEEEEEGRQRESALEDGEVVVGSGLSSALGEKMGPGAWWELELDSPSDGEA